MFGCFRKGEANDPDTYVAAITATLARFPEEVITTVTNPAFGLPQDEEWLPSVRKVRLACEVAWEPIKQAKFREERISRQLAEREAWERRRDEATGEKLPPASEGEERVA